MNEENPYQPSATVAHVPGHVKDLPRLLEVAKWQKYSIYALTAFMVFFAFQFFVLREYAKASPTRWLGLPLACATAFAMLRMSKAVFGNWIAGIVVALLGLVPCVGLITFALINQMAVSMFDKTGYGCGIFGMWSGDYDRLEGEVMKLEKKKRRDGLTNASQTAEPIAPITEEELEEDDK